MQSLRVQYLCNVYEFQWIYNRDIRRGIFVYIYIRTYVRACVIFKQIEYTRLLSCTTKIRNIQSFDSSDQRDCNIPFIYRSLFSSTHLIIYLHDSGSTVSTNGKKNLSKEIKKERKKRNDADNTISLRFDLRENRILCFNENDFVIPEYLSITCASFDSYSTRETRSHTAMRIPRLLLDSSRREILRLIS